MRAGDWIDLKEFGIFGLSKNEIKKRRKRDEKEAYKAWVKNKIINKRHNEYNKYRDNYRIYCKAAEEHGIKRMSYKQWREKTEGELQ